MALPFISCFSLGVILTLCEATQSLWDFIVVYIVPSQLAVAISGNKDPLYLPF